MPFVKLSGMFTQGERMILNAPQGIKRDAPERDDETRIDDVELTFEERSAVGDFVACRRAVCARCCARIAEHGVGDEDRAARESGCREEAHEIPAGLIAGERHARAVAALPARCLGDEHHARRRLAVQLTQDRATFAERRAVRARGGVSDQRLEWFAAHKETMNDERGTMN